MDFNNMVEENFYKKHFKFYELSLMCFIAYFGLVLHKHGVDALFIYFCGIIPLIIFSATLIEQLENDCINLEYKLKNIYLPYLKFFGTDYYLMKNMNNKILLDHLYRKIYIMVCGPILLYSLM